MAATPRPGAPAAAQDAAQPPDRCVLHASCVAFDGRALLIVGPSGSGKSALALDLMALGAGLVADDRTEIVRDGAAAVAHCPPAIAGLIEARGVGLLRAAPHPPAPVALIVDLAEVETARLPPRRSRRILGLDLPLVRRSAQTAFPAALRQYMLMGRGE